MSATIFLTPEAIETLEVIRGLDYYSRCALSDELATDVSDKEGYYLKSDSKLNVDVLPTNADVALSLTLFDQAMYSKHVSLPASLRGCIFEHAPNLPEGYAEIVRYWSGGTVNKKTSGAVYFQNPQNEYLVDLSALEISDGEAPSSLGGMDELLSEGVVVCLRGLGALVATVDANQFLEIQIPIQLSMLGLEQQAFRSNGEYSISSMEQYERIFLKIEDILRSPNPDDCYIDILRYEMLDYGYYY